MLITDTLNLFLSSALGNDNVLNERGGEDGQANADTLKQTAFLRRMEEQTYTLFTHCSSAL